MDKQYKTKRHLSDDVKKKISESCKGIKRSQEYRDKCRERNLGTKKSAETKLKMSLAKKGHIFTDEQREKMRLAHIGKKLSKETIEKIRNANRERKLKIRGSGLLPVSLDDINKIKLKPLTSDSIKDFVKKHGKINLF